ncbi:MAG: radical SAM-associated putative lipoprotein [Bacteroidales bacterium]|nr:radical SAM-associated putative lipoprotein [Bacteroidales bacterium]
MKLHYLKLKHWLLATLLGALGFSACQSSRKTASKQPQGAPMPQEREEIRLMYGVPTMDFTVRGYVHDPAGRPIEGIEVNLLERGLEATPDTIYGDQENIRRYLAETSVRTGEDGRFEVHQSGLPQRELRLLLRDIDGPANGSFANQIVELEVKDNEVDKREADGWNLGKYTREVDVKLLPR